jgi:hypothetical protein
MNSKEKERNKSNREMSFFIRRNSFPHSCQKLGRLERFEKNGTATAQSDDLIGRIARNKHDFYIGS